MEVIELAKSLGEGIKNDPVLTAYDEAKAAYEKDTALVADIQEYNVQRSCLTEEFNRDLAMQDKDVIEKIKSKMDELAARVNQNENYLRFCEAQNAVNALMKRINETITYYAFGIKPEPECTHDCSTCAGCH